MSILFLTKIHPQMRDVHSNKCLQHYFSYFVAVSFIDGGNRSTRKKPPTCRRSLLPHPLQENLTGFVTRLTRRVPLMRVHITHLRVYLCQKQNRHLLFRYCAIIINDNICNLYFRLIKQNFQMIKI
jgi:hypothetical protein